MINNTIYFNQSYSTNSGINEKYCLNIINNKIYLYDIINDNIKIITKKNINPNSIKGNNILFYLGYNIEKNIKFILKCKFIIKNNCNIFYKTKNNVLLIITSNGGPMIIYKYIIYKKHIYIFNNILIQEL
jgi:hypothetical protein